MLDRRFRRPGLPLFVVVAMTLVASLAHAAAFDVRDPGWEGCSELLEIARSELGASRVVPVAVLNWSDVRPQDGVLVMHPQRAMDVEATTAFMKAGGRLAIVDDYGRGDEILSRFRIERLPPPARPVSALRNRPALAIAEPVVEPVAGHPVGPHPVVANVQRLVTNHPTGLRHPNLSPVLRVRAIGEPDTVVAVAGQVGKGRLFAMSDPSAMINQMLRYPGNRSFVGGLSRYLVDDDGSTQRQGRLFIVTNKFDEEGAFGDEPSLRNEFDALVRALSNAIADARRDGLPTWMLLAGAAVILLALGVWVVRSSALPYKAALPRYARATSLVGQGGVAGRFALLAAPSSPRSLALIEVKSALFEALVLRFGLESDPTFDRVAKLVRLHGGLDPALLASFSGALATMKRVEASVAAGRPVKVPRPRLEEVATIARAVLEACGADATHTRPSLRDPSSRERSDGAQPDGAPPGTRPQPTPQETTAHDA